MYLPEEFKLGRWRRESYPVSDTFWLVFRLLMDLYLMSKMEICRITITLVNQQKVLLLLTMPGNQLILMIPTNVSITVSDAHERQVSE